ncbi:single-stranded DNA-binding protein [Hyphomicrobium sp. ghe19]|uniref:single-stranded DNA-binding protein n=1 Tax=Hyphomicrobium sp. ghe19 TaxID=2682968 RepID=UPI0013675F34|nr:Single-stranded DNA-binding protein [Hyphomicrobium sp. ghe19]
MAGYLNKVQIIGNVGQDPDFRDVSTSQRVANLSIATTESWKDKATGEKKERTEWHRVTVWNDGLVSVIEKYVKKGSKIFVEGALQTRKWKDKEGNDRYTTEVNLTGFDAKLILLGDNGGGRGMSDANDNASRPQAPQDPAQVGIDDEIPF